MSNAPDRKSLINEYKRIKPERGVVIVRNKVNGKVFIDTKPNVYNFAAGWLMTLKSGTFHNSELQADFTGLGPDTFEFEVVEKFTDPDDNPAYDYKRDLKALLELCREKLKSEDCVFYNKEAIK